MGVRGDKARLSVGGRPLLETAVAAGRAVAGRVVLAPGDEPRYTELGLPLVLDARPDAGPLAGLVAGLEEAAAAGAAWVVVLACDLPRADANVLRELLERARARDLDACLLETAGGLEPLVAVYNVCCAGPARAALLAGRLRATAFHDGLRVEGLVAGLHEQEAFEAAALNLNTPEDLDRELDRHSTPSAEHHR